MTITGLDPLFDRLLAARDRLARERAGFLAARAAECLGGVFSPLSLACRLDPGEFQTRADSALALIEALESFVGVVLPRLEELAAKGDQAAAARALEAARRILTVVGDASIVEDLLFDVQETVVDIVNDAKAAAKIGIGGGVVIALAVLAVVVLMKK